MAIVAGQVALIVDLVAITPYLSKDIDCQLRRLKEVSDLQVNYYVGYHLYVAPTALIIQVLAYPHHTFVVTFTSSTAAILKVEDGPVTFR